MINISGRSRAAMAGVLVADIRGAEFEHTKAGKIAEMLAKQGNRLVARDYLSPWDKEKKKIIRKDQPTDDSELTARLAYALAHSNEFDPEAVYDQLRAFIIKRESMLADEAFGSGSTLRSALEPETYELSLRKFGRGEVSMMPSNGALMRNTAIALRYCGDEQALVRYARWQSCVTHMHPLSQAVCVAHALVTSFVLQGLAPVAAWEQTKQVLRKADYKNMAEVETVLAIEPTEPSQELLWPNGKDHTGHVGLSLRVALWASVEAKSFEDGVEKCVRIGGDTDTYGAIAGGMLGAHFGLEGIPPEWLHAAQGIAAMLAFADQLHKRATA